MPVYEYKCNSCQQVMEVLERGKSASVTGYCPTCKEERSLTKLFSLVAAPKKADDGLGFCGEPRGSCAGGACGCAHH